MVDQGKDPNLGRIMMSFGHGESAFRNWRGDHNVVWLWGLKPEEVKAYLNNFQVKPEWVLSPYDPILDLVEDSGYHALKFWSGVNPRFFKPLGGKRKRKGYGYAGLPKSKEQEEIVLSPAIESGNLDWITKNPDKTFLPLTELNKWYNSKKIVFGMIDENRHNMTFVPTRFFETIASGTPLISYKFNGCKEHTGIEYPFLTTSAEETKLLMSIIEGNYQKTLNKVREWSKHIREKHNYEVRLTELFGALGGVT